MRYIYVKDRVFHLAWCCEGFLFIMKRVLWPSITASHLCLLFAKRMYQIGNLDTNISALMNRFCLCILRKACLPCTGSFFDRMKWIDSSSFQNLHKFNRIFWRKKIVIAQTCPLKSFWVNCEWLLRTLKKHVWHIKSCISKPFLQFGSASILMYQDLIVIEQDEINLTLDWQLVQLM